MGGPATCRAAYFLFRCSSYTRSRQPPGPAGPRRGAGAPPPPVTLSRLSAPSSPTFVDAGFVSAIRGLRVDFLVLIGFSGVAIEGSEGWVSAAGTSPTTALRGRAGAAGHGV
jgi:hypothetical protein